MGYRLSLTIVLTMRLVAGVNAPQLDEYHVKAAFLCNFAKFVDWPAETFRGPDEPFSICVLGQDPFGSSLDDVAEGKVVDGRPLKVRRVSDARQTEGCRILFVSSSERKRTLPALAAAKQLGVLTVGETGSQVSEAIIITFSLEGAKVRFEINIAAAEERKLRLSSKLLSLATAVKR